MVKAHLKCRNSLLHIVTVVLFAVLLLRANAATRETAAVFNVPGIPSASLPREGHGQFDKTLAILPHGELEVFELTASVPTHRHNHTDELIYVVGGTAHITLA